MAYILNGKGKKTTYATAKIAHEVTQLYVKAVGSQTTRWRSLIADHAKRIMAAMNERYGQGSEVEWKHEDLREVMEQELLAHASLPVQEAFYDSQPRKRTRVERGWDRFEAKREEEVSIDPIWGVRMGQEEEAVANPDSVLTDLANLGQVARPPRQRKTEVKKEMPACSKAKRSDWIIAFRGWARQVTHALDMSVLERHILKMSPNHRLMTPDQWWDFWNEELHMLIKEEPRFIGLLGVLFLRKSRASLMQQSWLDGTDTALSCDARFCLDWGKEGATTYREQWILAMQAMVENSWLHADMKKKYDWEALASMLQPDRDRLCTWTSQQHLIASQAVWSLSDLGWAGSEPPQWAFMRTAMALSLRESDPQTKAVAFYQSFSQLFLLPSMSMMREGGKRKPNYMEDEVGWVEDRYEAVHDALHRTAIGTKWTGTMTLDWSHARAQGALIAGRRRSQGPMGFMRSVHSSLNAQGRVGEDRPVTVLLSIAHRDVESFVGSRETEHRLQPTLLISDAFMQCLQKGEEWVLFDPATYPEAFTGDYAGAKQRWEAQGCPKGLTAKTIPAERLWKRILENVQHGTPFLVFEGSLRSKEAFPDEAPNLPGIDGVGALPVPRDPEASFVRWPAMAVNLQKMVNDQGEILHERMKQTIFLGMRCLDNAIILSQRKEEEVSAIFRPVCLGNVGFFEAVEKGTLGEEKNGELIRMWVRSLSEQWGRYVVEADMALTQERGACLASQRLEGRLYHPQEAAEKLKRLRHGALAYTPQMSATWPDSGRPFRFSGRTLWAPFEGSAKVAGTTPGGMGTLRPIDWVVDEHGQIRSVPSPFLMFWAQARPEELSELRETLRNPLQSDKWSSRVRSWTFPDAMSWETRLQHATEVNAWVDQGLSLTLPMKMSVPLLSTVLKRAWWLGLPSIRFDHWSMPTMESEESRVEHD